MWSAWDAGDPVGRMGADPRDLHAWRVRHEARPQDEDAFLPDAAGWRAEVLDAKLGVMD